jgi:acylphosphatase
MKKRTARLYVISGRVQGVGYRFFAVSAAQRLNVSGWARNLADGRVEVYACGTAGQLDELEGWLRKGPRFADVRGVEVTEAAVSETPEFYIR